MPSPAARPVYLGSRVPAERAGATDAGLARFDGCLASITAPREEITRLLPADLALAERGDGGHGHPLIVMFGEHVESSMVAGGLLVPTGLRYWELCFAIPYVVGGGGRYLHTYVPRMCSSVAMAVWQGNTRFGFAKERADMRWDGDQFIATGDDGGLLWHAAVEARGAWGRTAPAGLDALVDAFALPIAGRRADRSWVESYFRLGFGDALLRPARAVLWFDTDLLPGLAPQVRHASLVLAVRGMTWRLTHPDTCHW